MMGKTKNVTVRSYTLVNMLKQLAADTANGVPRSGQLQWSWGRRLDGADEVAGGERVAGTADEVAAEKATGGAGPSPLSR